MRQDPPKPFPDFDTAFLRAAERLKNGQTLLHTTTGQPTKTNIWLSVFRDAATQRGQDLMTFLKENRIDPEDVFGDRPLVDTEYKRPPRPKHSPFFPVIRNPAVREPGHAAEQVYGFDVTINDGADTILSTRHIALIREFLDHCYRDDVDIVAITSLMDNTGVSLNQSQFMQFAQAHINSEWGETTYEVTAGPMGDEGTLAYLSEARSNT